MIEHGAGRGELNSFGPSFVRESRACVHSSGYMGIGPDLFVVSQFRKIAVPICTYVIFFSRLALARKGRMGWISPIAIRVLCLGGLPGVAVPSVDGG
jgi:hypothetical protein